MDWRTDLAMYREALRAERIATARWDIKTDRVYGDSTMMNLFPGHLTDGPYSEFLLRRPGLHPNDVKYFESLMRFLQAPHHEHADASHEIVVEYRLADAGGRNNGSICASSFTLRGNGRGTPSSCSATRTPSTATRKRSDRKRSGTP